MDLEQDQRDGGARTSERRGVHLYTSSNGAAETSGVGRILHDVYVQLYLFCLILFFAVFHSFSLSFPFLINNFETELNNGWFGGQC